MNKMRKVGFDSNAEDYYYNFVMLSKFMMKPLDFEKENDDNLTAKIILIRKLMSLFVMQAIFFMGKFLLKKNIYSIWRQFYDEKTDKYLKFDRIMLLLFVPLVIWKSYE